MVITGKKLIKKLRELAKQRDVEIEVLKNRGKGSHRVIIFNGKLATVPNLKKELRPGTLGQILKDIEVTKDELQRV